ncbi:hypothetical protein D3C80_1651310 [compost metagenome]
MYFRSFDRLCGFDDQRGKGLTLIFQLKMEYRSSFRTLSERVRSGLDVCIREVGCST